MKKNIWFQLEQHSEVYFGQYVVPNFISNSIAIMVDEHELVVISPGPSLIDSIPEEWNIESKKISIIFPNAYHHLGVEKWMSRYPNISLYASSKACKQLNKKGFKNVRELESEQPNLPEGYGILFPPGHRGGDVWIQKLGKENDTLWITCDSFLNYDRLSNQPIARTLQKVLGAAPNLKISQVIKWLLLDNRKQFKRWAIKQTMDNQPTILIPSHGEVTVDMELAPKIKTLIQDRL